MNIQTQIQRTAAEELLLETFATHGAALPGDASVQAKRQSAADLIGRGLPTRRVESWHYTDLRRLLAKVVAVSQPAAATALEPLLEGSSVLTVLNSKAETGEVAGVSVASLSGRLSDGSLADNLTIAENDDTIGAINAAFVADGFVLDIPAGATIAQPIELQNVQSGGHAHARFVVNVGEGAKATIVERQSGSAAALVSSVSELKVSENAEVLWIILQDQPDDTDYLGQIKANIDSNAKVTLFVMNAGAKFSRQEIRVCMEGSHSEFHLRGVNLMAGDTHCDVTMVLDHAAPDTTSTETVRNIITDKADGVFQGMIRVAKGAQKTDATMACNTLLLSDEGGFSTKPELEIFADDVICGHGATITEIEKDYLFYLMARGINEKNARGLLVKAFLAEVIEELEHEQFIEVLESRLDDWFVAHG